MFIILITLLFITIYSLHLDFPLQIIRCTDRSQTTRVSATWQIRPTVVLFLRELIKSLKSEAPACLCQNWCLGYWSFV